MARSRVKVEGLRELGLKLNSRKFYGEPMRNALKYAGEYMVGKAEERAPKRTYKLAQSIEYKIDQAEFPKWLLLTAQAESSRGFRYPFALEAGRRAKSGKRNVKTMFGLRKRTVRGKLSDESYVTLHYKGRKKSTRKWFSGTVGASRARITRILNNCVREIEAEWQR